MSVQILEGSLHCVCVSKLEIIMQIACTRTFIPEHLVSRLPSRRCLARERLVTKLKGQAYRENISLACEILTPTFATSLPLVSGVAHCSFSPFFFFPLAHTCFAFPSQRTPGTFSVGCRRATVDNWRSRPA